MCGMLKVLFEGFVVIVLERTVNAYVPWLLPYAWFMIATVVTFQILNGKIVRDAAIAKLGKWKNKMYSYAIASLIGAGVFSFYWYGINKMITFLKTKGSSEAEPTKTVAHPLPPQIVDLFSKDFSFMKFGTRVDIENKGVKFTTIDYQIYQDFDSKSEFMSFYIPSIQGNVGTYDVCAYIPNLYQSLLDKYHAMIQGGLKSPGQETQWSNNLVFTGQIYIYYEDDLTLEQL